MVATAVIDGKPRTAIELIEGAKNYRIGEGLKLDEQEWLVGEINRHLESVSGAVSVENDIVAPFSVPVIDNNMNRLGNQRTFSWDD